MKMGSTYHFCRPNKTPETVTAELWKLRNAELQAERREQKIESVCGDWIHRHIPLIEQFYEIAERKVSLLDDYGDENWEALPKEIEIVINKIAKKEGHSIPEQLLNACLTEAFKDYHEHTKESSLPRDTDFSKMTGLDFETYVARVLQHNGFESIRGTPVTGDQGADLIATKDGKKIIVQAKRYEGTVGNKAVQEVLSAVAFYGGDQGWVITNSTFTTSAKQLAQRTGIILVDGHDLDRMASATGM
jgi:HJR/Mrr/RecB family endonuclease